MVWAIASLRRPARLLGATIVCALSCIPLNAQSVETDLNAPLLTVAFTEADTLRGVVERHLRDPDLWPTVLQINGIASPADLVPGIQLRLPVRQVLAADQALLASLQAIQRATAEGARIFAPTEIGAAIDNRDSAVNSREGGEWRASVTYSGVATEYANEAFDISLAQRDRSAEAIVSDVQGRVEGRAPAEPRWSGRDLNDVLVEFERLRTLSASTTQITFRDLSRLRLNPNSNATIQRMRSDPLTGGEVTKVSLVNGDFYALLNQLSEKSQFEIDVPGVQTTTNSADFWIKNDQTGARFVNYDAPDLQITSGSETIMVGENEGVVLTGQGAERTQVLTAPRLTSPEIGAVIYTETVPLGWDEFDGAEGYWLEVARDPGFNQMQISEFGLRERRFEAVLPPDRYHWRIAALDRLGLPGEWSTAQRFTVRTDTAPPFLTLLSPGEGVITDIRIAEVLGVSEPDAEIRLNGERLQLDRDGSFLVDVALVPGANVITLTAEDPAGNSTARTRTVIYRPSALVEIVLSDQIARMGPALATRSESLSVRGTTSAQPGAPVSVRDAGSGAEILRTEVGPDGALGFTVPVDEAGRRFRIEVLAPGGAIEGTLEFDALRDRVPPGLALDLPPPRVTSEQEVQITGRAGDASRLEMNGVPVALASGRFDLVQPLEPGRNTFELVASDAAGNVTVLNLQTVLDIDPPEILRVDLGRPSGAEGPIELIVAAQDDSGLVQAAPFVISVGGVERDGFLRCDTQSGTCRASLPPEPGRLQLIELVIEDYAGNAAFE